MNKILTVTKLNLSQLKAAYFITGLVFFMMIASFITSICIPGTEDNSTVSMGNTVALLPLFAAIFIPAKNLRKTVNLGAKRQDFFWSVLPIYAVLAAASSAFMLLVHYLLDAPIISNYIGVMDMNIVFGFLSRGPLMAFIQMFAFLFLFAAFVHTLTMAQTFWYGWGADVIIAAIISVFIPIEPLRAALIWFFNLIIFGNPALQIASCLILALIFYALSRPILNRKKI